MSSTTHEYVVLKVAGILSGLLDTHEPSGATVRLAKDVRPNFPDTMNQRDQEVLRISRALVQAIQDAIERGEIESMDTFLQDFPSSLSNFKKGFSSS